MNFHFFMFSLNSRGPNLFINAFAKDNRMEFLNPPPTLPLPSPPPPRPPSPLPSLPPLSRPPPGPSFSSRCMGKWGGRGAGWLAAGLSGPLGPIPHSIKFAHPPTHRGMGVGKMGGSVVGGWMAGRRGFRIVGLIRMECH